MMTGTRDSTNGCSERVGSADRGIRRGKAGVLKGAMNGSMGRILAKAGI
jgi:hypothetical protein